MTLRIKKGGGDRVPDLGEEVVFEDSRGRQFRGIVMMIAEKKRHFVILVQ